MTVRVGSGYPSVAYPHLNDVPNSSFTRLGLLSFLLSCKPNGTSNYARKDGVWHYQQEAMIVADGEAVATLNTTFARTRTKAYFMQTSIEGADAASFAALSDSYAKDNARVYYCDTYRKGQEYYTATHSRIRIRAGANAASFRLIDNSFDKQYAREKSHVCYEGEEFGVRDLESYEVLNDNSARDKLIGYFLRTTVESSNGSTFKPRGKVTYATLNTVCFFVLCKRRHTATDRDNHTGDRRGSTHVRPAGVAIGRVEVNAGRPAHVLPAPSAERCRCRYL